MENFEKAAEMLLKQQMKTEAKLIALQRAFCLVLADQSLNHDDPDKYVMTVLAEILEASDGIPPKDPDTGHIADALADMHAEMEMNVRNAPDFD